MQQDQPKQWESILAMIPAPSVPMPLPENIAGKTILITGAGGSIGSTLAHEISEHQPRRVILFDASEQSLYRIDRDLRAPHNAVLGSVCDQSLLDELLERYRPEIVFHTAAFKHVPLMELNPFAAAQNNILGTFTLVKSAIRHRVQQLVVVSTDKAVEPASIMGASKRIAELIVLAMQSDATRLKAVRLGNVLGSQGSVLPLFQSQIDRGEPLTVTHPRASRYFLTMQHAAQLLLLALGDEFSTGILVPMLRDPIRIEEIARRMLANVKNSHLSAVTFTGLRPGDKLTEKLIAEDEAFLADSESPLRMIASPTVHREELVHALSDLKQAVQDRNLPQLLRIVSQLVPAYRPSEVIQANLQEYATGRIGR